MTRSQLSERVGDAKSPALLPREVGLRAGADQATLIQADTCPPAEKFSSMAGLASALSNSGSSQGSPEKCRQILWFTFFFDGTGNNLDADEGMLKHSNVAKLFRVHKVLDDVNGIYPIYIPGVGTYFAPVNDDGGSKLGLGCGDKGRARLDHAMEKFDAYAGPHLASAATSSNAILEINISAFGFSRGAALARAFINAFLEKRCILREGKWELKQGGWPLRIRFMGIFDTVASVGLPMSTNTVTTAAAISSNVRYMINARFESYSTTRPEALAFCKNAKPGADPAPGKYDGHTDWGGQLAIDDRVEEVRHFVAAHEIRNSFPLDSVSVLRKGQIAKSKNFFETVYPGVHSDVGGSYCPGEGGRAAKPQENLGLIPLLHMYKYALLRGVPLLPKDAWEAKQKQDFETDPDLLHAYNHYLRQVGPSSTLGTIICKNMALFFAWRFRAIRKRENGDKSESQRIAFYNREFKSRATVLDEEIATLTKRYDAAVAELDTAVQRLHADNVRNSGQLGDSAGLREDLLSARTSRRIARDRLLRAKARKNSLPNMEELQASLDLYDSQIMADVTAIRAEFSKWRMFGEEAQDKRLELRPHYKTLVAAYENEFEKNKGLTDSTIIGFFDKYVHDSLAGFGKDATIPSDPRVVYLGGDAKYEYAQRDVGAPSNSTEVGVA